MRLPRTLLVTVVMSLFAVGLFGGSGRSAETSAERDPDSPYVAGIYPQIPNARRPWQQDTAGQAAQFERVHAAGLRWVYVWVAWSDIEKSEGVYDQAALTQLDEYLRLAREHGLHVSLQLMIGGWSNPQPWNPPLRVNSRKPPPNVVPGEDLDTSGPLAAPPVDLTGPRDWAAMLVERYKPGGVLARQEGWGDYGVTHWELENEPDSIAWWGDWSKVPKDYAQYVSLVVPAMKTADPDAVIKAPALSHRDGQRLSGLQWLEQVLEPGDENSEWASDTYRETGGAPGAGPFIDAISFHRNNPTLHDKQAAARADVLRALASGFSEHPHSPMKPGFEVHYSEGSALQYSDNGEHFAWAQAQLMTQLHGVGVDRMVLELGAEVNRDPWPQVPLFKAVQAVTTHLPRADETVPADQLIDPERVTAYLRTDPETGLRTWVLWAHTLPPDAPDGEPFTVDVPVRTAQADVLGWDWGTTSVDTVGDSVPVTLRAGDPSPLVMVVEVGALE